MRATKIIILSLLLLISLGLRAQGVDDAILYSQIQYEGTARSMAMGNATGEVKRACHRVTDDNDHDGAALAIESILEKETASL